MSEVKEKNRATGLLVIDDGYTLVGRCEDKNAAGGDNRPPITFRYRPALPEDTYEFQRKMGDAESGAEMMAAQAAFLDQHIQDWTGLYRVAAGGQQLPVTFAPAVKGKGGSFADPAIRRALGAIYLKQMASFVTGYTVGEWEDDAKNS